MSKRRVTFSKTGMGKYVSHLDLLRCFARAIQRSGLPVVYSQGFNPHQKMTFSLPLPIGVTGERETVDIQFEDWVSDEEIMAKLNQNLPMDMKVSAVAEPIYKAAEIVAADYRMEALCRRAVSRTDLESFFSQQEISILKRTKKKGEVTVNLMEFILDWQITGVAEKGFCLMVTLLAGGERNLKPELLSAALEAYLPEDTVEDWDILRKQIYRRYDKEAKEIFV